MKIKIQLYGTNQSIGILFLFYFVGLERVVVVTSFETFREALVTRGTDFAGRKTTHIPMRMLSSGFRGIAAGDYTRRWIFTRKLAYRSMHLYGNGLEKVEDIISDEIDKMCSVLTKENGKPVPLKIYFGEFSLYPTGKIEEKQCVGVHYFLNDDSTKSHSSTVYFGTF